MEKTLWIVLAASLVTGCAGVEYQLWYPAPGYRALPGHGEEARYRERGIASFYADKYQNRLTANGERFNQYAMTAAHKTLPFGTLVRVVNLDNGRSCVVRINDRGPFIRGRIIDLSRAAFSSIADPRTGIVDVVVEVLD